ncbi:MAG: proprotein convertase P-domain-containing protein [Dokdonella sp.]
MRNHQLHAVLSLALVLGGASGVAHAAYPSIWFACGASCPARIPDRNGATNGQVIVNLAVPAGVCSGSTFASYAVYVDVQHSHIGDLRITLTSPLAQTVQLLSPLSAGACAADDIGAKFRDGADAPPAICGPILIPGVSGVTKPSSPLSAFGNSATPGIWQLAVRDESHGADGQVNNAALIVNCTYSDDIFHDGFEFN